MPTKPSYTTKDGSTTLYLADLEEYYHSKKGAIQESLHVFIKEGLEYWLGQNAESAFAKADTKSVRILEYGFGTGLNALLTALHSEKPIHYTSLEKYPLSQEEWQKMNYADRLGAKKLYQDLHTAAWGDSYTIKNDFNLLKVNTDFCEFEYKSRKFDLIFYDAFGPKKQPALWSGEQLKRVSNLMSYRAVFVTYSAAGHVRRSLEDAGLEVDRIPGPPGKREMLRAVKQT